MQVEVPGIQGRPYIEFMKECCYEWQKFAQIVKDGRFHFCPYCRARIVPSHLRNDEIVEMWKAGEKDGMSEM